MIDLNETAQVGQTNLSFHRFGLGGAHITKSDEKTGVETVQYALEHGIKFIDTAPLYTAGVSETYIGQALKGVPRDQYVLASKVGRLVRDNKIITDYSRDGIFRSLEESLCRLKLDHIDILHLHDADNHYQIAIDEAFPALHDLRRQGVIKAVGAGMNQWEMLMQFAQQDLIDCCLLAGRYTLLEQESLSFLALCHQKKVSVILGGVYNSGILSGNLNTNINYNYSPAPEPILDKAHRIQAICQQHNVPLNAAALQFPMAHPGVAAMVIGAENKDQVAANIKAAQTPIPAQFWLDLQAAGLLELGTPTP
ncbi:MAG: aldo/keto reductase [Chloroflexota bacterium]